MSMARSQWLSFLPPPPLHHPELCLEHLHLLEEAGLVRMEDGFTLQPTETGRLMARYYVAFESMKRFLALTGREDLSVLVS